MLERITMDGFPRLHLIDHLCPDLVCVQGTMDRHAAHELIYLERGRYRCHWQGGEARLEPGQGLLLPRLTAHQPVVERDHSASLFVLQWRGPAVVDVPTVITDPARRLLVLLRWLFEHVGDQDADVPAWRDHLLGAALIEIQWSLRRQMAPTDGIDLVRRLFDTAYPFPLSLDQAVARSGYSRATFLRRFRTRYGCPPMRYLQRVRVEAAANLLASEPRSLAAVARAVGLSSASHLSRLLRQRSGA